MKTKILAVITGFENINIELNDTHSPQTCKSIIYSLPFSVSAHVWGEEIYTDESPISQAEEKAKDLVSINDVAYWPSGKAICLFFGPTPIGKNGEIKPYSPVNVVGKIIDPDKSMLKDFNDGVKISFKKIN